PGESGPDGIRPVPDTVLAALGRPSVFTGAPLSLLGCQWRDGSHRGTDQETDDHVHGPAYLPRGVRVLRRLLATSPPSLTGKGCAWATNTSSCRASTPLLHRAPGGTQVRQRHLRILPRQQHAVRATLEGGPDRLIDVLRLRLLLVRAGGDVDVDPRPDLHGRRDAGHRPLGLARDV